MGITVSKKIGKAVVRNRVKRVVREFVRLYQDLLPGGQDIVIVPKKHPVWSTLKFKDVEEDLSSFFKSLREKSIIV